MAEDRDEDRGFTVSDRRRFSPETGEPRSDEEGRREDDQNRGQAQEGEPRRESVSAADSPSESPKESGDSGAQQAESEGKPGRTGPVPEITLPTFIMSLSTQVLMLMGEIPDPTGRTLERDMTSAKQVIDILGMLKEKTKGNLDKTEEGLLDSVLYDLRMRYVELTKVGTKN